MSFGRIGPLGVIATLAVLLLSSGNAVAQQAGDHIATAPPTAYEAETMSPQNMDYDAANKRFPAHPGWLNDQLIHYYKFRMYTPGTYPETIPMGQTSPDIPISPLYLLTTDGAFGGLVSGQHPIIRQHHADGESYSDFAEVVFVTVPGNYVANTHKSAGDLEAAGLLPAEGSGIFVNAPLVPTGSTLEVPRTGTIDVTVVTGSGSEPWRFDPPHIVVAPGTTVRFTNEAGGFHTVTSSDSQENPAPNGIFDGQLATAGSTFEHTFNDEGIFAYYCKPHSGFMRGTVTVASQAPIMGVTAWYRGVEVQLFYFETTDPTFATTFNPSTRSAEAASPGSGFEITISPGMMAQQAVRWEPIWHINQIFQGVTTGVNNGGPANVGQRNVIAVDRLDAAYSPLWQVWWITQAPPGYVADQASSPAQFTRANGFEIATTPMFVNCPNIGPHGGTTANAAKAASFIASPTVAATQTVALDGALVMRGGESVSLHVGTIKVDETTTNMMGGWHFELRGSDLASGTNTVTVQDSAGVTAGTFTVTASTAAAPPPPPAAPPATSGPTTGSPGLAAPLVALALVGAAVVGRSRRQ